jgi:hypothetical protein
MNTTTFVRMPTNKQLLTMGLPDLPEDAFGGIGPRLTPIARALGGKQPTLHGGGGGGLKAVVGVVAAIAVPVFAPQIAASIGLSGAVSTALAGTAMAGASGAISSAIVGAALGAVTAAATGQNVGRGALFGGIGGGISGYQQINAATGALNTAGATAPAAGGAPMIDAAPVLNPNTGLYDVVNSATGDVLTTGMSQQQAILVAQDASLGGIGTQLSSGVTGNAVGYQAPVGLNTSTAPVAGSSAPSAGGNTQVFDDGSTIQVFDDGSTIATDATGVTTSTNATQAPPVNMPTAGTQTAGAQTGSTITDRLATGVQKVGSEIAKKFTDPKQQADLLLKAAGQIAGSYIAGDGMSPEEKQLLDQQRQELEYLRSTNQELFKEKLAAAQQLVQDANYFDPEYFGLQRARQVQQAGARVERERLAGIDPRRQNLREAEKRRTRLATGRDVGTAYDTGFTTGVDAQTRARTAGLNLYPTAPSTMGYAQNLMGMYDTAYNRRRQEKSDIGTLFGTITGGSASRSA